MWDRGEENIVTYLPNYSRVCLAAVGVVLAHRPWALLGLVAVPVLRTLLRRSLHHVPMAFQAQGQALIQLCSLLLPWWLGARTGASKALSGGLIAGLIVCGTHAALRVPPSGMGAARRAFRDAEREARRRPGGAQVQRVLGYLVNATG